jgi:hypothetical protein
MLKVLKSDVNVLDCELNIVNHLSHQVF